MKGPLCGPFVCKRRGREYRRWRTSRSPALGAQPADVVRGILGPAIRFIVFGIAVGVAGAAVMTRTLAHLLTQLSPNDPVAFGAAVAVLAPAALAGAYLPARRATRIDPAIALRRDM